MDSRNFEPGQSAAHQSFVPFLFPGKRLTHFVVYGEPARKSNQRRIARAGDKIRVIKSEKALQYEKTFSLQVPAESKGGWGSRENPVFLVCRVFHSSNRPDLSLELILDLLQKTGVITNDRWVKGYLALGYVDKDNPRVEITLYEFPGNFLR